MDDLRTYNRALSAAEVKALYGGTEATCTVTFDANGGEGSATRIVNEGEAVGELPEATRKGFQFLGWYTDTQCCERVTESTIIDGDVTYYALWRIDSYVVTFDANGGDVDESSCFVEKGKAIGDMPTPEREEYAFLGWFTEPTGGKKITEKTRVNGDMTVYAQWRFVGRADESTIYINTEDEYETEDDGSFELNLLELVESYSDPKITLKGLPSGLKFNTKTGLIAGKATKPGVYEVVVSAKNKTVKTAVTATFTLTVPNLSCDALPYLWTETDAYCFELGMDFSPDNIDCSAADDEWKVSAKGLPSGLRYDAKTGVITGVPTKAGTYTVTFTASKGKEKQTATITLNIAALPEGAVGTFSGFVKADDEEENIGTVQLTATDSAKLAAKVITADGSFSFAGNGWASSEDGVYGAELATKKGEKLTLSLDSTGAWNSYQLTGTFATADGTEHSVQAQCNAFGKKAWYFAAEETDDGWTLSYAENAKAANLTVTLKADGSTAIAGKLGALSVKGSGYADVAGMEDGVIYADFAPVVSTKEGKSTVKRVLSIRTNLWFDRSNEHAEGVGSAKFP